MKTWKISILSETFKYCSLSPLPLFQYCRLCRANRFFLTLLYALLIIFLFFFLNTFSVIVIFIYGFQNKILFLLLKKKSFYVTIEKFLIVGDWVSTFYPFVKQWKKERDVQKSWLLECKMSSSSSSEFWFLFLYWVVYGVRWNVNINNFYSGDWLSSLTFDTCFRHLWKAWKRLVTILWIILEKYARFVFTLSSVKCYM